MTTESLIPYDEVVQEALRAVIGRVLARVAETGLPGAHHFYIAFKTGHPETIVPGWLREKYPDEMTIVIQNRFWDLQVHADRFEVGLSFNQRPERLVVPYAAVVGFVDPSVNFALQFQVQESDLDGDAPLPTAQESSNGDDSPPPPGAPAGGPGNVVSLDRFRKK